MGGQGDEVSGALLNTTLRGGHLTLTWRGQRCGNIVSKGVLLQDISHSDTRSTKTSDNAVCLTRNGKFVKDIGGD